MPLDPTYWRRSQEETQLWACTTYVESWHSLHFSVSLLFSVLAAVLLMRANAATTPTTTLMLYVVPLVTVAGGATPVTQCGIALLSTTPTG